MPKVHRIPERMCVGCREMKPKRDLIRVVRSPEGEISLDLTGKKAGRGAYICPQLECLKRARKSRALARALDVSIGEEIYDRLEERLTVECRQP